MSANESTQPSTGSELDKGKGKQAEQNPAHGGDMDMDDDDDDDSDEDSGPEEQPEEPDEDNMEEIDTENILGDRTRGKVIDWNEAEQKSRAAGDTLDDEDDDDDDDDFVDPDAEMED